MNCKYLLALTAAAGLSIASHGVAAKGFNYSFFDAGYRNIDSDDTEGDGAQVSFSYGATDYVNVVGSYSRMFIDDRDNATDVDLDLDEFKIGFGGHYPVHKKVDIGGTVSYVDQEITGDEKPSGSTSKTNVNESDEGYDVLLYGRIQAAKKIEVTPHVVYTDVGDFSGTGFGLGFYYKFYKDFHIRLRATSFSEDSTTNLFAGIRYDF
jgi:hypothetical protein